jgi:hypothetical protein
MTKPHLRAIKSIAEELCPPHLEYKDVVLVYLNGEMLHGSGGRTLEILNEYQPPIIYIKTVLTEAAKLKRNIGMHFLQTTYLRPRRKNGESGQSY